MPTEYSFNPGARGEQVLTIHTAVSAGLAFLVTLLWAVTGAGAFWPAWVWISLALLLGVDCALWYSFQFKDRQRAIALHVTLTAVLCGYLILIWLVGGAGPFWPGIPVVVLGGLAGAHWFFSENWEKIFGDYKEKELTERVEQLQRTRQGALEAQAAQLRQVERDLHDGAQSRLVALSMQLARAETKLGDNPEAAELVREARAEAGEAITELRDLARGIAPPILADRGLAEAARSLGARSPAGVTVVSELERRPAPVVETAAYFVIAESLTNAAKYAPDSPVNVNISDNGSTLDLVVSDEGPGGAVATGNGLTGLRHRVEALDGTLEVISPVGEGTVIKVELPCE